MCRIPTRQIRHKRPVQAVRNCEPNGSVNDGEEKNDKIDAKKKKATTKQATKKKPAKRKTTKRKTTQKKKPRKRSRGAKRNAKTQTDHAANAVVDASEGRKHDTAVDPTRQEVPESYRPGPSVQVFDGTAPAHRDREVILKMLDHPEWTIPTFAFEALPNRLVKMALNIGVVRDDAGNVIEDNVPDAGNYSTNQQLTAIRMLKELNEQNLKKLTALKPAEVRVLNENQTVVTIDDQRLAALEAINAELRRRESGGTIPNQ